MADLKRGSEMAEESKDMTWAWVAMFSGLALVTISIAIGLASGWDRISVLLGVSGLIIGVFGATVLFGGFFVRYALLPPPLTIDSATERIEVKIEHLEARLDRIIQLLEEDR